MIVILSEHDDLEIAHTISRNLQGAYPNHLEAFPLAIGEDLRWPADEHSWDDVLIVLFRGQDFPDSGTRFISNYNETRIGANVLPIALRGNNLIPPKPIDGIKALHHNGQVQDLLDLVVLRVGAILGLRLRRRESNVFISYRSTDGRRVAEQLHNYLRDNGFRPWLDEARDEFDNEQNIPSGSNVQKIIEDNLNRADLVLLIDTPQARYSRWIRLEIDTANAHLIPILPVCCKAKGDNRRGPRFSSLRALQRWIDLEVDLGNSIEETRMAEIMKEMEIYLRDIYGRRLRIPQLVRSQFVSHGFDWTDEDQRRRIYMSSKRIGSRLRQMVISHCSVLDDVYPPSVRSFVNVCAGHPHHHHSLFIYDGEIIPDGEIEEICKMEGISSCYNLIILHHQEVPVLLESDFRRILAC